MDDPYETLGIGAEASSEEIRTRYLELVRQYTPERSPQKFAAIHEAYDQLRDPVVGLQRRLFDLARSDTPESLLAAERKRLSQRHIPTEILLSLGQW